MTKNTFENPKNQQEVPNDNERDFERERMHEVLERRIAQCPSQEIQNIKKEVIDQLLLTEQPEEKFNAIEEIFIKNNLPPVGKCFRAFAILNPPEKMTRILEGRNDLSPCLREASTRKRYAMLYRDLLRVHIASNNRDLRAYVEVFRDGQHVFDHIATEGFDTLTQEQHDHAMRVCVKIMTLRDNARNGFRDHDTVSLDGSLEDHYATVVSSIGVAPGQSVTDRLARMFLAPAGFTSIDAMLAAMDAAREDGHRRGMETAQHVQEKRFVVGDGDVVRGVRSEDMGAILQGATVSRELFAPSSTTDLSPYDYDVIRVGDVPPRLDDVIRAHTDSHTGAEDADVYFLIRNRDQFYDTTTSAKGYTPDKLEIFARSPDRTSAQWGVRTGPPASEIDLLIATDAVVRHEKRKSDLLLTIAQNERYIPVVDVHGTLLFTPEQYEQYRQKFCSGIERYGGDAVDFTPTRPDDAHYDEVMQLRDALRKDRARVEVMQTSVYETIAQTLMAQGISLYDASETAITGADIFETGSTARGTNAPQDYDFDFTIRLDAADMEKAPAILSRLKEVLGGDERDVGSSVTGEHITQLRLRDAVVHDGEKCDVDVTVMPKSELLRYGSHDAAAERLAWMRDHVSHDAYEQTIANILLTKRLLKEYDVYLMWRESHPERTGGIGGIGVENWILANGGNMIEAFRTFYDASHDSNGRRVPFAQFRSIYTIIDPGENFAENGIHNNYFGDILTEAGYEKMQTMIETYLQEHKNATV